MAITYFVRMRACKGEEKAVQELLVSNMDRVRRDERGNLAFAVHRSRTDPREFWLYETWVDEASVEAHESSAAFVEYKERIRSLVEPESVLSGDAKPLGDGYQLDEADSTLPARFDVSDPDVAWGDFARAAPELASRGEKLLRDFTLAYVATVRRDGSPRVHPMTITLHGDGLYVFPVASTPKAQDFELDGRYALHAFPHLPLGTLDSFVDDEFACSGRAVPIDNQALRADVLAVHNDSVGEDDRLFRLDLERAHHKTRVEGRAIYLRWQATNRP